MKRAWLLGIGLLFAASGCGGEVANHVTGGQGGGGGSSGNGGGNIAGGSGSGGGGGSTAGGSGSAGGSGEAGGSGSGGGGGSSGTPTSRVATIKTTVANTYVGATNGGGSSVYSDRYAPQAWETFTLVDVNGGDLVDGDSVNFKTSDGHYLSAAGGAVNAQATSAGATETFHIGLMKKADGGSGTTIADGDQISLRDSTNTFMSATNGGGTNSTMTSTANAASADETFYIGPQYGLATTESLAGWTLSWSDEFNGAAGAPDATKWTTEVNGSPANSELEYYTNRLDNVTLDGQGNLDIIAKAESYMGHSYTSGRLNTSGHFTQAYGRFEARVWMPTGQGIWPAFWVLGDNIGSVSWPQCGELDIMETIGTDMDHNHGSMHGPGYSGGQDITGQWAYPGTTLADGYHNYALEWQPNQVQFFVDGNLYETRTPADLPAGTTWVYDHPFFIILNVAVGGTWPGSPDGTTVFPQTMKVDYVRVYTKS